MRAFIFVLVVVLALIFVGGGVPIGRDTIFGHIDSMLGTTALMNLHHAVFSLLYRGEETLESGVVKTDRDVKEFQERPIGIDNKGKYRLLDEAAKD